MTRRQISSKQLQILQGIADGELAKTLAGKSGLSEQTVKNHLKSIRIKLGALTTTHAVAIALRRGLIK